MNKIAFELIYPDEVKSFVPAKNTKYVLSDDFLKPFPNITEDEYRIAQKYLSLFTFDLEGTDQLIFTLQAVELFNLFICISREKSD